MTKDEIEEALDGHRLWVQEMWNTGPRWYLVRRNGRTKLWKSDPKRWEIPIKWKLKDCLRIGDWNIEDLAPRLKVNPGPGIV